MSMLGSWKISISPVLEGEGLDKAVENSLGGVSGKLGSIGASLGKGVLAGVSVATGALGAFAVSAVKATAAVEQNLGGAEAVFGDSADSIKKWAAQAAQSSGLGVNAALETANVLGAIYQGTGFSAEQAASMTTGLTERAIDLASVMGVDVDSALQAVTGASKGNFAMMDNLGVAMNIGTLNAYALSKGLEQSYTEMGLAEKQALAYEYIMEKSAYAAGNFQKENQTLAGSMETLSASWESVLASLHDPAMLEGAMQGLSAALTNVITAITTTLPSIITGMVTFIKDGLPEVFNMIIQLLPELVRLIKDGLPPLITALMDALPLFIEALITGIVEIFPVLIEAILLIAEKLLEMLPDIVIMLIDALIVMAPQLLDGAIRLLMMIVEALPIIIIELLAALPELMISLISALVQMIPSLLMAAVELFMALPQAAFEVWPKIFEAFGQLLPGMKDIGSEIIAGLMNGIMAAAPNLLSGVAEFCSTIVKWFKDAFDIHSPSRLFADMIGSQLTAGISVGIEDEAPELLKEVSSLSTRVAGAFAPDFDLTSTSSDIDSFNPNMANSGNNVTINQTIDTPKNALDVYLTTKRAALAAAVA